MFSQNPYMIDLEKVSFRTDQARKEKLNSIQSFLSAQNSTKIVVAKCCAQLCLTSGTKQTVFCKNLFVICNQVNATFQLRPPIV